MKKLMSVILASAIGLALSIHAEGNGPTTEELASEFFTTNRSLPRDQRDTVFQSQEAADIAAALVAQDSIEVSSAQRFLTMWAPANMDDAQSAQAALMAVVEKGTSPAARSTSALFILRNWGTQELAEGWVNDGTLLVGHYPGLSQWPTLQQSAYEGALASGVLTGPYQVWFRSYLPEGDAAAIGLLDTEIRALLRVPESEARNAWLKELRAIRAVRAELAN